MNIVVVTTVEAAQEYLSQGYEGVELSLGNESLGRYDHHGDRGHLPAVCLQAFEDLRDGKVEYKEDFVATGAADLDACAFIALVSGILFEGRNALTLDGVEEFVRYAAKMDTDPIGMCPSFDGEVGKLYLAWEAMTAGSPPNDPLSFYKGVAILRDLLQNKSRFQDIMDAALKREEGRYRLSLENMRNNLFVCEDGKFIILTQTTVFGFPEWYNRKPKTDKDFLEAWEFPCVVALTDRGNITVGCANETVAEKLFGKGGLQNVLPLFGEGWGGRGSIGGSPRGQIMTEDDLRHVEVVLRNYLHC